MSTLEIGKGQGSWGSDWRLRLAYYAFTPVRLALRVEDRVHAAVDVARALVDLVVRGGLDYGATLDRVFPPEEC